MYKKASFFERLFAHIIDFIIVLIVSVGFSVFFMMVYLLVGFLTIPDTQLPTLSIAFTTIFNELTLPIILLGTYFAYNAVMLLLWGATVGKMLLHIKVVHRKHHYLSMWTVFLREAIGKTLSTACINMGYLWCLLNENRRTWHDHIAHTFVIKVDDHFHPVPQAKSIPIGISHKLLFIGVMVVHMALVVVLVVSLGIDTFITRWQVDDTSMQPALKQHATVVFDDTHYMFNDPQRGDVVLYTRYDYIEGSANTIKTQGIRRVFALPGDTFKRRDGQLYINDQELQSKYPTTMFEPSIDSRLPREGETIMLPDGHYMLAADNPSEESTSAVDIVALDDIVGKYWFCYQGCR